MKRAGTIYICIAVIMVVAGIASAQQRPDEKVRLELQKRVQPGTGITFELKNGVVTLTGNTPSYAQKMAIINIARRVVGVREVVDKVAVVPSQKRTDDEIVQSVRSVLEGNLSRNELAAINIKAQKGTVILSGTLTGSYPKQIAGVLSGWTPGVVEVVNNITVKPSEPRTDPKIEADITSRFQKNPFISDQKIHVSVTNSVVTLTGVVDRFITADQAEAVVRFIPGVIDVNNQLFVRALGT